MNPLDWIQYEVLNNSLLLWSMAGGVFVVVWMVTLLARRVLCGRLAALAKGTDVTAVKVAERIVATTKGWFLFLIAAFIGSRFLAIDPDIDSIIANTTIVVFMVQVGLWAVAAFLQFLAERREDELEDNPDAVAAMDVLAFVVRVAIWSIVLLVILDNLGVNITTLVAGMGVGGIAVALAAQNIIGDLFASLSIVLDKPFVVGDFLIIGEYLGNVEKVGIKTTRIRSLSGEQLIFANNDLLGSRIRNYGRMFERRIVFSIGVTYQTPSEKLKKIPGYIREAIEEQSDTRFDRAHFQSYGDFALIFEAVYFVLSPNYNRYMDIQQAINLQLYEVFEREEIEFAYPTQTLYVAKAE